MRRFLLTVTLCVPTLAAAQDYHNTTMVVVGGASTSSAATPTEAPTPAAGATTASPATANALPAIPAVPPNFPEWAVSQAGQNTAGNTNPQPDTPAPPPSPAAATSGSAPATVAAPANPAAPESPVSKLWPRDTVPIFVKSCVGFHVELIPSCTCVITTLMAAMPHDEFLKRSADGSIESDPRLTHARTTCAATPERKETEERKN